jgi:hypothetical protein
MLFLNWTGYKLLKLYFSNKIIYFFDQGSAQFLNI